MSGVICARRLFNRCGNSSARLYVGIPIVNVDLRMAFDSVVEEVVRVDEIIDALYRHSLPVRPFTPSIESGVPICIRRLAL